MHYSPKPRLTKRYLQLSSLHRSTNLTFSSHLTDTLFFVRLTLHPPQTTLNQFERPDQSTEAESLCENVSHHRWPQQQQQQQLQKLTTPSLQKKIRYSLQCDSVSTRDCIFYFEEPCKQFATFDLSAQLFSSSIVQNLPYLKLFFVLLCFEQNEFMEAFYSNRYDNYSCEKLQ